MKWVPGVSFRGTVLGRSRHTLREVAETAFTPNAIRAWDGMSLSLLSLKIRDVELLSVSRGVPLKLFAGLHVAELRVPTVAIGDAVVAVVFNPLDEPTRFHFEFGRASG